MSAVSDAATRRRGAAAGGAEGRRKRIAVIGGGPAGMVTVKELKEKGFEVTGFEQRGRLGGVYNEAYAGLQLTSSSVVTSFGSFIPHRDVERGVVWQCGEYLAYLDEYARHFDLERHFRLGTAVRSLRRASDGGWRLRAAPAGAAGGAGETELHFDHVVICGGNNQRPRLPEWADASRFDGEIRHSSQIRDQRDFAGKRVLVAGMGESGSDIALMAAKGGVACTIAVRSGPGYVIPRFYRGLPTDLDTNRCHHALPRSVVAHPLVRFKVRIEDALATGPQDLAVLRKASEINRAGRESPFNRFATKSTAFVEAIVHHGAEYRTGGVAELKGDRVVFTDGTELVCDLIVCCTGFTPAYPYLEEHHPELVAAVKNPRALYKRMLIPGRGLDIAWVGYARPAFGSVPPIAEMQARYLALLLSGARALPSEAEMRRDAEMHAEFDLKHFVRDAERMLTLTDFYRFMETTAQAIGCRPSVRRMLLREPGMALRVLFGPLSAAQYRLDGPGADPLAARAALRKMPTMPWPVLAYEFVLLAGCWALGLMREPWRPRAARPAPARVEEASPLPA
ncbi:MAG TPA: FAD-dependent oxidoreductase [Longimicrobium sp.]|nr:FAD-dependent oxidoreductase [Longimicrobium sp.]